MSDNRWSGLTGTPATVRPITVWGDAVLHQAAAPVLTFDRSLAVLVDDMFATMYATGRGVGLAAPQVGVGLRVFVFDCGGDDVGYVVNPVLDPGAGELQHGSEGCLSIPDIWVDTSRFMEARVHGVDVLANPVEYAGRELLARCFQHEVDHLNGRLYVQLSEPEVRRQVQRLIRSSDWFQQGARPVE
jgi:peptide deformylase